MAAGKNHGSDWSIVVVLLICVITGIIQGARGMVRHIDPSEIGAASSSVLSVDNARSFDGTVKISTSLCTDTPDALDQVRYRVQDAAGSVVARRDLPLVADRERQAAMLGMNLPAGDYDVTVTCLANGQPTERTETIRQSLGATGERSRPARLPETGR